MFTYDLTIESPDDCAGLTLFNLMHLYKFFTVTRDCVGSIPARCIKQTATAYMRRRRWLKTVPSIKPRSPIFVNSRE